MRVVAAVDKFRGSATSAQAGTAVGAGIRSITGAEVDVVAVADGGEGSLAAALALEGFKPVQLLLGGDSSKDHPVCFARRDDEAVIELAAICGQPTLGRRRPAPLTSSSQAFGEVLSSALRDGCRRVVLAVGGSLSTDGGAGMLQALGARVLDHAGRDLGPGGGALVAARELDLSGLDPRISGVELVVASDVANPLLGDTGAARMFGPQKGATPADVALLEEAMTNWAEMVAAATGTDRAGQPGAGAAGGVGFAALAVLDARITSGSDYFLDLAGFDRRAAGCDLAVTGEGALDAQTLQGKLPTGVAARSRRLGLPVVAVTGRDRLGSRRWSEAGLDRVYALEDLEPDQALTMGDAERYLQLAGRRIAEEWLRGE